MHHCFLHIILFRNLTTPGTAPYQHSRTEAWSGEQMNLTWKFYVQTGLNQSLSSTRDGWLDSQSVTMPLTTLLSDICNPWLRAINALAMCCFCIICPQPTSKHIQRKVRYKYYVNAPAWCLEITQWLRSFVHWLHYSDISNVHCLCLTASPSGKHPLFISFTSSSFMHYLDRTELTISKQSLKSPRHFAAHRAKTVQARSCGD